MDTIKEFFEREVVMGNDIGNFMLLLGIIVGTLVVGKVLQALFRGHLKKLADKSETQMDNIILETFDQPVYLVVMAFGFSIGLRSLEWPRGASDFIANVTTVVITLFVAWSLGKFIEALRRVYIDPLVEKSDTKLDDQIVPILESGLKAVVWVIASMIVFTNLGYDIVSLLTGLGIGGLALAMAAKDTLANVFGSLTIFADKPFQIDDVVKIGGYTGTVVDVGLRTCRVKTFDGTLVTVPNQSLVGDAIENFTARTARKQAFTLGLEYDTTADELEDAMNAVREILEGHELIRDDFVVRFNAFGDSALEISVIYWVEPVSEFFGTVHAVNMAIKRAFEKGGWQMAFPSQTVYVKQ